MYELNDTVYITTQNTHLRLSNENLVVEPPDQPTPCSRSSTPYTRKSMSVLCTPSA